MLSDTHGYIDNRILDHSKGCDEIWHAGDIGDLKVTDALSEIAPVKAVYGNIDNARIRTVFPLTQIFSCEGLNVYITHIGGYPGRYKPGIGNELKINQSGLFICGHSHILKVIRDPSLNLLHINPGAAGISGFHKIRTLVKFKINQGRIEELAAVELGPRGSAESDE